MFCPKCGTKNADEAKFCVECGATLPSRPQAPAATQPTQTPAPAPQPTGAPKPQPNPFAAPKQQTSPFGANAPAVLSSLPSDPFALAGIVAAIVMVICYFLPLVSVSIYGFSYSMSCFNMTFGNKYTSGVFADVIFLAPGIAALLVALLVKKPQPRAIAQIAIGAITIIAFLAVMGYLNRVMGYINEETYGIAQMSVAFYLFIICGVVLVACGIKTILDNKKAAPTA